MTNKKQLAILALLLLASCTTGTTAGIAVTSDPYAEANATADTSSVAVPSGTASLLIPLLAIEIEVTADGVKPIAATIVLAPPKPHSGVQDLRVKAVGANWEHTFPDPRLAEVEGGTDGDRTLDLESARTFIYVPLAVAVTGASIKPTVPHDRVSRGGEIDVRALAAAACSRSSLPVCSQIIDRFGGAR